MASCQLCQASKELPPPPPPGGHMISFGTGCSLKVVFGKLSFLTQQELVIFLGGGGGTWPVLSARLHGHAGQSSYCPANFRAKKEDKKGVIKIMCIAIVCS